MILVDDVARSDEQKMVELWLSEFPGLSLEPAETEKGAVVLRKSTHASMSTGQSKVMWAGA